MSEEFKIEIVNPDKSFLSKDDVTEVVVPAFEGEMGILRDHISIISFLKPGVITIQAKSGVEKYYVEDGIVEFKNNNLLILSSQVYDLEKTNVSELKKMLNEQSDLDGDSNKFTDKEQYINFYKKDTLENIN